VPPADTSLFVVRTPKADASLISLKDFENQVRHFAAVLCCAVLCCAVLFCALLCFTVLYCAVLHCTVLCFTVLCCAVLHCGVVWCGVVRCGAVRGVTAVPCCCCGVQWSTTG
jgi:hypothetical protein